MIKVIGFPFYHYGMRTKPVNSYVLINSWCRNQSTIFVENPVRLIATVTLNEIRTDDPVWLRSRKVKFSSAYRVTPTAVMLIYHS